MKQFDIKKVVAAVFVLFFGLMVYAAFSGNSDSTRDDLSGVIIAPPQDFFIIPVENNGQEFSLKAAALELEKAIQFHPEIKKIALQYQIGDADNYFLLDLNENTIQNTAKNEYGTIVQTTWIGSAIQRIQWCKSNGDFTPEGLSAPESRNLYH